MNALPQLWTNWNSEMPVPKSWGTIFPFLLDLQEYEIAHPVCIRTARFWKTYPEPDPLGSTHFLCQKLAQQCFLHGYWEENLTLPKFVLCLVIWPVRQGWKLVNCPLEEFVFSSWGSLSSIPLVSPPFLLPCVLLLHFEAMANTGNLNVPVSSNLVLNLGVCPLEPQRAAALPCLEVRTKFIQRCFSLV